MLNRSGGIMAKRVLLVRGGSLGRNTGLGAAHHNLVDLLENGKIEGWELAGVCEYPLEKTKNPISRIWQRWSAHPRRIAKEINRLVRNSQCDLVHITDQEQAHLMPQNCPVPGVITIHDLFHLFPARLQFSDEVIAVGDTKPGIVRRRDLHKLKAGINRANHLLCNSKHTLDAAMQHFPNVASRPLPLGIDSAKYHPDNNQLIQLELPDKCNLLVVGSNDPRKRMKFLCKVIAGLPDDISSQIHIHHVGNSSANSGLPAISEMIKHHGLDNWTIHGSSVSDEYLMTLRLRCEALLFPSVSEGFGYPPIESMAAGMPVVCANLPSHNELMPDGACIPADDADAWSLAIRSVVEDYQSRKPHQREPQLNLIEHAKNYDNTVFCHKVGEYYSSIIT
ncbi:MAG TPA: glycosyltransferase [Candidatus Poseidoniales archaeon]|nr:MAG TPA: glycosyltransferase [Candidatus Poseidoniales archaeon]